MLPVQVKIESSASCTLSEASALLQRFLSSDACSDSFARDYVANVAQALQDSISRRSGKHITHLHFPTPAPSESPSRSSKKLVDVKKQSILVAGNSAPSPPHSKRKKNNKLGLGDAHTDEKQSLSSAEDVGQDADVSMEVGSAMPEAAYAFERRKKKRRHSAVENGLEMDLPPTSEMADSSLMHHDKKRRKKEKHETETDDIGTEGYGPDDQKHHDRKRGKEKQELETEKVVTEYPALHSQNFHGKKKRKKEKQGNDMGTLLVPENRRSPVSLPQAKRKVMDANNDHMSAKVEEFAGSSKRKQKEGKAFHSATPVKDLSLEKKREETDIEASHLELENLASDEKNKTKKKRRRKEELGS